MADWRILRNADSGTIVLARVKLAVNFWEHFKGLQLSSPLPAEQGLLFVTSHENRTETAIHMFFMRFSIAVVWLDAAGRVVDTRLAKPWRPAYAPRVPAQYFLEAMPPVLDVVRVGDRLRFDEKVVPEI